MRGYTHPLKKRLRNEEVCTVRQLSHQPVYTHRPNLFTYSTQFFPDASSTAIETATFDTTLGTSVLNEDSGTDEVYAKAVLTNTYTGQTNSGKSNVISRKF